MDFYLQKFISICATITFLPSFLLISWPFFQSSTSTSSRAAKNLKFELNKCSSCACWCCLSILFVVLYIQSEVTSAQHTFQSAALSSLFTLVGMTALSDHLQSSQLSPCTGKQLPSEPLYMYINAAHAGCVVSCNPLTEFTQNSYCHADVLRHARTILQLGSY